MYTYVKHILDFGVLTEILTLDKFDVFREVKKKKKKTLPSKAVLICNTVDSRYLEIEGTLKNSSRYPYFDISDL